MLEKIILDTLNNDHYIPSDYHQIAQEIMYQHEEYDLNEIYKMLVKLENEYKVIRVKNDKIQSLERLNLAYGRLDVKRKGFGFVRTDDFDVFVKSNDLNGAINKDEVLVKINKKTKEGVEGYVYRVVNHGYDLIVGEVVVVKNKVYVKADDSSIKQLLRVTKKNINGAIEGHKVLCYITEVDKNNGYIYVAIKTIIGHINDVGIDILSVVYKHGFNPDFSKEAIKEAKRFKEEDIKIEYRVDLREKITMTIDGADAKDLDDAISLEINEEGNRVLSVSIADVSYYVSEKSELDKEAYARGTSVYLVDRVVPMIPHQLSNGICSLLPNTDRLTQTCRMEFDDEGKVINHEIFESIIKSDYRLTYDEVNQLLEDDEEMIEKYKDIRTTLNEMHKLSLDIRKLRYQRGMLEFDVVEPKIIVDSKGEPQDIIIRERGEGEKLIEDFMIIANETVASHIYWMDLPFIYRTHEDPNPDKIAEFLNFASVYKLKIKGKSDNIVPKDIQHLLEDIAKTDGSSFLDKLLLRSMSKAKYEKENIGHFGLASKCYTHFTSPIRRYPDLIVHRLLRKYLYNNLVPDKKTLMKIDDRLVKIGEKTSQKERDAIEAEREVNDMKLAQYMLKHIGEEFSGHISSVTNFGLFIELTNTVEGLVHISTMQDDHYTYNPQFHMLIGQRTNKQYRLGDKVDIIVESVDIKGGNIDFILQPVK
ncbi:MAG: ribonuclease R [Erysipelotrichales bacterium]